MRVKGWDMRPVCWGPARRAGVTLALLTIASAATAADQYTVRMNGPNGPLTLYVSPTAVRRTEPGFHVDVIYRLVDGKILYIDNEKKTYSEVSLDEARQHGTKAATEMSPQQKAMMTKMGVGAPASVTKIGPGETIAGFATEKYVMKTPAVETEILAAPTLTVPNGYYDMARASAGAIGAAAQPGEALKTIKGMILKRVGTMTMNNVTASEVTTAVDTHPIPPATFTPPARYKKVPKEW
jgi:hypothetical protein